MNKLITFLIATTIVACNVNFIQSQLPYPTENQLKITLDESFKTKVFIPTIGEVLVQFNPFQIEGYVTAPECLNCEIYGNGEEQPFLCDQNSNCQICSHFQNVTINENYKANGDFIHMDIKLDQTEVCLSQVLYIRQINEISLGHTYSYNGIGISLNKAGKSSFIQSLYEEGKIDSYSYSLYYDNNYHLTLGGYNQKLISKEFYNLKAQSDLVYGLNVLNELVLADITLSQQTIQNSVTILIDPTIDNIIIPEFFFQSFIQSLRSQRQQPDISSFTLEQPGKWRNLKAAPSFTISFLLDDPDAISRSIDVMFSPDEFMIQDSQGLYIPNISFDKSQHSSSELFNIVKIGKPLLQKMMYYKYINQAQDGTITQEIRGLAPLRKKKSFF